MNNLYNKDVNITPLENHPADGRIKIIEDGTIQTLTSRMGTGGNNVPLILIWSESNENICNI